MLKGHGDDIHNFSGKIRLNFSSNVWHGGPSGDLLQYLQSNIVNIGHYPEPEADSLKNELAKYHRVASEFIQVTSGATEAIHLIGQAFPGGRALIITPTFSEYEDACIASGMELRYLNWPGYDAVFPYNEYNRNSTVECSQADKLSLWLLSLRNRIKSDRPDIVFICNPNNPGGEYIHPSDMRSIISDFPGIHFVIDEAYLGFLENDKSVFDPEQLLSGLIVIKSLTKTFAIPGIRLGFLIGNPEILNKIQSRRIPWSVSAPAVAAGQWIVRNGMLPEFDKNILFKQSRMFEEAVDCIEGFAVRKSLTHYFLVRLYSPDSKVLKQHLVENNGILIRDASNFRGLDEHWIRLATRNPSDNDTLVGVLHSWSKERAYYDD